MIAANQHHHQPGVECMSNIAHNIGNYTCSIMEAHRWNRIAKTIMPWDVGMTELIRRILSFKYRKGSFTIFGDYVNQNSVLRRGYMYNGGFIQILTSLIFALRFGGKSSKAR